MQNSDTKKRCRKLFFGWIVIFLTAVLTYNILSDVFSPREKAHANSVYPDESESLPIYTAAKLKEYDGTNPGKPIYIGFEGFVYDVSAGSTYYKPDGPYHYLAGRDSTQELRLIGGDIIKRKYPVIGILK